MTPQPLATVTMARSLKPINGKVCSLNAATKHRVAGIPGVTHLTSNAEGGGVHRLPPLHHPALRVFAELQRDLQLRGLHRRHRQPARAPAAARRGSPPGSHPTATHTSGTPPAGAPTAASSSTSEVCVHAVCFIHSYILGTHAMHVRY
jgi:hypothetical protein